MRINVLQEAENTVPQGPIAAVAHALKTCTVLVGITHAVSNAVRLRRRRRLADN